MDMLTFGDGRLEGAETYPVSFSKPSETLTLHKLEDSMPKLLHKSDNGEGEACVQSNSSSLQTKPQ